MDADGDFVVVWSGNFHTYLQRFDAAGVPQGPELEVGDSPGIYPDPAVAMDADGDFVVVWVSENFVEGKKLHARRYGVMPNPASL